MEDNKKKGLSGKYLGMILVLVTFLAAVAVYMAVFTKTNEKNKSIQSEIDTKKAELDELKSLEAGKKKTEKNLMMFVMHGEWAKHWGRGYNSAYIYLSLLI